MKHTELGKFLRNDAVARFLGYVQVDTASDDASATCPSTPGQRQLGRQLAEELRVLGVGAVTLDAHGYLYATIPASPGATGPAISFCAHLDTSPSESGAGVTPRLIEGYDGGEIRFPDAADLVLSPDDSPELARFAGETLITASGTTLLGADDKAGLAAIMAAVAAIQADPRLPRPELRLVFTPDEEIGRGADRIDMTRLGRYGYTVDGGLMGELEAECFDAREAVLIFSGRNIHPGYAKDRMINAAAVAARFVAALPEYQTPEHTEKREGFWHLTAFSGDEGRARVQMILRDFQRAGNDGRIADLGKMVRIFTSRYPGLGIEFEIRDQYRNMDDVLKAHPQVIEKAEAAMAAAGVSVIRKPIRGGTDGARLSFMGMPCPNLFAGGLMFHSKTEWIPAVALEKSAETILHLCRLWAPANP